MPISGDDRALRRARQQRVRRRRNAALAAAVLLVGGGIAAAAALSGGSSSPSRARASSRLATTAPTTSTPAQTRPRRRSLEQRADRAVQRFAKLGLPLYCGGGKGKYVALTFDDGPGPYTERYAFKILRRSKLRVTFFDVGKLLSTWPTVPRRELAFGAVGDHTWTHPYLPGLSTDAMRREIASTQSALAKATGRPIQLFRPPYGARNEAIDRTAQDLGMVEVLWSIDSLDSQGADFRGITKEVLTNLRPGSIVLMHENRGQTIEAFKFYILPALKRAHWKAVTIPELLALDPPTMAQLRAGPAGCGSRYVPKS